MKGIKIVSLLLTGMTAGASFAACASETTGGSSTSQVEGKGGYWYEMLYEDGEETTLVSGATIEIPLDKDVGNKSYFWVELETDVNLVGYLYYENSADPTVTNKEKFFIERGTKDFTSFLDSFRVGALGAFEKKVTKLTLQNVDSKAGEVELESVGITDRTYDTEAELYIGDEYLKMGTSFAVGGAIQHIEKLNAGVVEYVDEKGYVHIEAGIDAEQVEVVSEEVNLVNIYDLGREIQQSYYSTVGEENGYAPTEEILYDAGLSYNPVQAGSAGHKEAQIIDYTVSETEIWIKVKPLEWFFDNTLSDSYMENTYRLDGGGHSSRYQPFRELLSVQEYEQHTALLAGASRDLYRTSFQLFLLRNDGGDDLRPEFISRSDVNASAKLGKRGFGRVLLLFASREGDGGMVCLCQR